MDNSSRDAGREAYLGEQNCKLFLLIYNPIKSNCKFEGKATEKLHIYAIFKWARGVVAPLFPYLRRSRTLPSNILFYCAFSIISALSLLNFTWLN